MQYYLVYLFRGKVVQIDKFVADDDFYNAMYNNSCNILFESGTGHCNGNKPFDEVQKHEEDDEVN